MKLYRAGNHVPEAETYDMLKKGYGITDPRRINGYNGMIFQTGDVYLSDSLFADVNQWENLKLFVQDCLSRFVTDDYGDVCSSDRDENIENKWLGNGFGLYGRYYFEDQQWQMRNANITIRKMENYTYVAYEMELDPAPVLPVGESQETVTRNLLPEELRALVAIMEVQKEYEGTNQDLARMVSENIGKAVHPKSLKQLMNARKQELEEVGLFFQSSRTSLQRNVRITYMATSKM